MTDKRDTPSVLCVFEVDGKPCGRNELHSFHFCLAVGSPTHDHPSYSYCHPYTPPAETGREQITKHPSGGYWCSRCKAKVTSQHVCSAARARRDDGYCSCGVLCETGTRFRQHLASIENPEPAAPASPAEQDCDCPCDTCAIGTGKHCGKAPCDVREVAPVSPLQNAVEQCLHEMRQILKGRCDALDLGVIRDMINVAIGKEEDL